MGKNFNLENFFIWAWTYIGTVKVINKGILMANYCLFLHSIVGAANDLYSSINKAGGLKISMIPFNFKML